MKPKLKQVATKTTHSTVSNADIEDLLVKLYAATRAVSVERISDILDIADLGGLGEDSSTNSGFNAFASHVLAAIIDYEEG